MNKYIIFVFICIIIFIFYLGIYKDKYIFAPPHGNDMLFRTVDGFNTEKQCLTKLKTNYEYLCKKKQKHFPEIINIIKSDNLNKAKMEESKNYFKIYPEYTLELTNMGISLNKLSKKEIKEIKLINFDSQINCILHNLKKSQIYHRDIHISGKNTTLNKNTLCLIDFDTAKINSHNNNSIENFKRLKIFFK